MENIYLESEYVTQSDINKCLEIFKEMKNGVGAHEMNVIANCVIKEIDILLIAYFILFKKQLGDKITIKLDLNHNSFSEKNDLIESIKQYSSYAYSIVGNDVFMYKYKDSTFKTVESEYRYFRDIKKFANSKFFAPLIFVNKDEKEKDDEVLYQNFFESGLKQLIVAPHDIFNLDNEVKFDTNSKNLLDNIYDYIKIKRKPISQQESFINLAIAAFYACLNEAKILTIYMDTTYRYKKVLRPIGNERYKYYEKIKIIFDELYHKPLIYQFVFYKILSSKHFLFNPNKEPLEKILFKLWDFTKDLVYGLKEIAKNIGDHAIPPMGVITLKIYDEKIWKELKQSSIPDEIFENYMDTLKSVKQKEGVPISFMDINVIDFGQKGVIETLEENCEKLLEKSDNPLIIKEDIQTIKDGKIKFRNFLDGNIINPLNMQTKRAIAHLGLLVFSNLILKNKGLIRASTWLKDTSDKRDPVLIYEGLKAPYEDINVGLSPIGTNYHIALPIALSKEYKTQLPHFSSLPLESTASEISGIEELFSFNVINAKEQNSFYNINAKQNYIIVIKPEPVGFNRESEHLLWEEFNNTLKKILVHLDNNINNIICIDLDNNRIEASTLFRFLGNWEYHYPKKTSLIIVNVYTDILLDLIKINNLFSKDKESLDFWNANSVTLVYSYMKDEDRIKDDDGNVKEIEHRFYFADALWGKTKNDFINLNKLIGRTNFNANSTFEAVKSDVSKDVDNSNMSRILKSHNFFYDSNVLLPFDLLIKINGGVSLFEYNCMALLNNELSLNSKTEVNG